MIMMASNGQRCATGRSLSGEAKATNPKANRAHLDADAAADAQLLRQERNLGAWVDFDTELACAS
jgi:hypothetical protein